MDSVVDVAGDAEGLFGQRYRDGSVAAPEHWNAVLGSLLSHRSVRAFLPRPVTEAELALIVAAAQSASTSSNLQAWSVLAIRDPQRKARLSMIAGDQAHMRAAPLLLAWLADLSRLPAIAAARGIAVDGVHYLELMIVALVDAALAAQNAVAALESMGLGCVYIGALRNDPEAVAAELGLPPMVFPVFGMCVGTPDPARPAEIKPRLPQSVVLHHEQYRSESQAAEIAVYDARLGGFQAEQAMPPEVWTERVTARVRSGNSLSGRHRMRAALAALGFELR